MPNSSLCLAEQDTGSKGWLYRLLSVFIPDVAACCEPCGSDSQPLGVGMVATWCRPFCVFGLCVSAGYRQKTDSEGAPDGFER